MFIVALFIIVKTQEQYKHPSIGERISKTQYTHMIEYQLRLLTDATSCVNLENIRLNERSQRLQGTIDSIYWSLILPGVYFIFGLGLCQCMCVCVYIYIFFPFSFHKNFTWQEAPRVNSHVNPGFHSICHLSCSNISSHFEKPFGNLPKC